MAGQAQIARALRIGEQFAQMIRAQRPQPWIWLPSSAQHWLAIVRAFSLRPWAGGSPDYRVDPVGAFASWNSWLNAYAAELAGEGFYESAPTETDQATIDRWAGEVFSHYGTGAGNWNLLAERVAAEQAVPPVSLGMSNTDNRWVAYCDAIGFPSGSYIFASHRQWYGNFEDPQWDERQCWAAVGTLVLTAHNLGGMITARPANVSRSAAHQITARVQTIPQTAVTQRSIGNSTGVYIAVGVSLLILGGVIYYTATHKKGY